MKFMFDLGGGKTSFRASLKEEWKMQESNSLKKKKKSSFKKFV